MATKTESEEIGAIKPKCGKLIYPPGGYYGVPCGKTATYEEGGAYYCKTHHPPNVEAKQAAKHAKWDAEFAASLFASKAADDELAAMRKNAARYLKVRRGQHWSVIDGIGDALRGEALDAAVDAEMANAVA